MDNDRVLEAFFCLLKAGLWSTPISQTSCFPLDEKEWLAIFDIAKNQTVEGIIYDGIQKLDLNTLPKRELLLKWVVLINNTEKRNEEMIACIDEQIQFFDKIGVSGILLKGQGIAQLYSNPNRRICGDIDWYFNDSNDSQVLWKELHKRGIKLHRSTINSFDFKWRKCDVDIHIKLFDAFSPIAKYKLESKEIQELLRTGSYYFEGNSYKTLPPSLNILQVNLHILKHLLMYGIGLRQFCDSAVLYDKLYGKYDNKWLETTYKDVKIINWVEILHHFLVYYIGLSEDKLPFPLRKGITSTWLMKDVISTGNFGHYDNAFADILNSKIIVRKHKGKRLWYSFKKFFPLAPLEAVCYPIEHFKSKFKLKSLE